MAYKKHTWETNQVITASKMNNIEEGIEAANNNAGVTMVTGTLTLTDQQLENLQNTSSAIDLDKTLEEIINSYEEGKILIARVIINGTMGNLTYLYKQIFLPLAGIQFLRSGEQQTVIVKYNFPSIERDYNVGKDYLKTYFLENSSQQQSSFIFRITKQELISS